MVASALLRVAVLAACVAAAATGCDRFRYRLDVPPDYDKSLPDVLPSRVNVTFFSRGVNQVDDFRGQLSVALFVTVSWTDSRLVKDGCTGAVKKEKLPQIWLPDLYFVDADDVRVVESINNRREELAVRAHNVLFWGFEVHLRIRCEMHFARYPFDRHTCALLLRSSEDMIEFVTAGIGSGGPETVLQHYVDYGPLEENQSMVSYFGEAPHPHSFAGFNIRLVRKMFPAALNIAPTFMLVIIALIGFWMPPESVPGRMGMLLTCMLCLVNMSNNGSGRYHTFTALDLWMGICKLVVAIAIAEYAVLLKMMRNQMGRASLHNTRASSMKAAAATGTVANAEEELCRKIDRICFAASFTGFLLFSTVYAALVFLLK